MPEYVVIGMVVTRPRAKYRPPTQAEWWASAEAQARYWDDGGEVAPWLAPTPVPYGPPDVALEAYAQLVIETWSSVTPIATVKCASRYTLNTLTDDETELAPEDDDGASDARRFARWWRWWVNTGRRRVRAGEGGPKPRDRRDYNIPLFEIEPPAGERPRARRRGRRGVR